MAKSLDYWRGYFSGANADICDIIENAVTVAALDHPEDLKLKRDHIAELLFTCQLTNCFRCERVEPSVPKNGSDGETLLEGEKLKSGGEFDEKGKKREKERKADCGDDGHAMVVTYEEAEELNEELEKESQLIEEVLRIKEILDNPEESDSVLLDSLRRIQLMDLSVELLQVTEVGKSVKLLKKHGSKKIRDLAVTLIKGWVEMLDTYYVNTTTAINEDTPESMKTSTVDSDEGLPSPPLEEGAFVNHSMELSKFFDGMDDDLNPINNGDVNNNRGSGRKPPPRDGNVTKHKQQQLPNALYAPPQENKVQQTMKEETAMKKKAAIVNPNKPSSGNAMLMPTRAEQKVNKETKSQPERDERALLKKPFAQDDVSPKYRDQQSANAATRKKPLPPQKEKLRSPDEAAMQVKTEVTKRKFQERYQEPENAKKQRIYQVTPLHDITKQGAGRNLQMKPGHSNYNRH